MRQRGVHDRDTKFCASFRVTLASGGIKTDSIARAEPEAERGRSVKEECREADPVRRRLAPPHINRFHRPFSLRGEITRAGNVLNFPDKSTAQCGAGHGMGCRERLGGPSLSG